MNLTPRGIREHLKLNSPIYRPHVGLRPFRSRARRRRRLLLGKDRSRRPARARSPERRPPAPAGGWKWPTPTARVAFAGSTAAAAARRFAPARSACLPKRCPQFSRSRPRRLRRGEAFSAPARRSLAGDRLWRGRTSHRSRRRPVLMSASLAASRFSTASSRRLPASSARASPMCGMRRGDAQTVLEAAPDAFFSRVFMLYPDPWPKRRHRKRRVVVRRHDRGAGASHAQGAELRFATDIDDYAGWTLARFLASPHFRWAAARADDWRQPWPEWRPTRYEAKARKCESGDGLPHFCPSVRRIGELSRRGESRKRSVRLQEVLMSESLDRRTLLKGARRFRGGASAPLAEALGAQADGLQFDPPVPFTYDLFRTAGARTRPRSLRSPAASGPGGPAEDQLRGMGQDPLSATTSPCSPTGLASFRSRFSTSACSSRRRSGCMSSRAARRARSSTSSPISKCRPIRRRATCRRRRLCRPARSRRRATARSTGARTTGSPSSAPPTSGRSANSASMASHRAASRLTSRSRTGRRSFPDFTDFYIDSAPGGDTITLYALMEGPSIVGAFRFLMTRGKGVVMDIQATMFTRAQVSRFGIAPLTSMYWFSETKKETAIDWRPEVHDSDGLAMWSGNGERLWRPSTTRPASWSRLSPTTTRAASASCSATGCSTIISTASSTTGARACGSSRCRARTARAGARGRSSCAKSRPTTRSTTMSWRCGCRPTRSPRAPNSISTTACTGSRASPFQASSQSFGRPASGGAASRACRARRGCSKFMVEFLGGPLSDLPYGVKPDLVVVGLARNVRPLSAHRGGP